MEKVAVKKCASYLRVHKMQMTKTLQERAHSSKTVGEELLASRQLLSDHAGSCYHSKAAVVELLGLHLLELFGICGLKAKWVKAKVSWYALRPRFHRPAFTCTSSVDPLRRFKGENGEDLRD